jgi:hypothetical protein
MNKYNKTKSARQSGSADVDMSELVDISKKIDAFFQSMKLL